MKNRLLIVSALILCAVMLLCSCSASDHASDPLPPSDEPGEQEGSYDIVTTEGRKIVYTVRISVTVGDLKEVSRKLSDKVGVYGGWIEASEESRGWLSLTCRVPVEDMNEFTELVSGSGEVRSKSVSTSDITERYADAERSKDLYVKEYEAYAALYETLLNEPASPENTENKLAVLKAMQEASAMIDSFDGKLSSYDRLVDYATFSITLYGEDAEDEGSYWDQLGDVFLGSIGSMGVVFGFMLKAAVAVLPYAAVIGGVVVVLVLLTRIPKKKKEKRDSK